MEDKFIVTPKNGIKENKSVIMTIRLERELQEKFDKLSMQSERSRNELICMALRYALEHLEFLPNPEDSEES